MFVFESSERVASVKMSYIRVSLARLPGVPKPSSTDLKGCQTVWTCWCSILQIIIVAAVCVCVHCFSSHFFFSLYVFHLLTQRQCCAFTTVCRHNRPKVLKTEKGSDESELVECPLEEDGTVLLSVRQQKILRKYHII